MPQNTEEITTCYGPMSAEVMRRAKSVRLLICDVDGVLSDGLIYMGNSGEEIKAFHARDGYGICTLINAGIEVAVITGRKAKLVEERCEKLGITSLYQGKIDKLPALYDLLEKFSLSPEQVAYIGDDVIDLPVMKEVGLSVAVADAHPLLAQHAHYCTRINGGRGAVREICDILLIAQGKFDKAQGKSQ